MATYPRNSITQNTSKDICQCVQGNRPETGHKSLGWRKIKHLLKAFAKLSKNNAKNKEKKKNANGKTFCVTRKRKKYNSIKVKYLKQSLNGHKGGRLFFKCMSGQLRLYLFFLFATALLKFYLFSPTWQVRQQNFFFFRLESHFLQQFCFSFVEEVRRYILYTRSQKNIQLQWKG